MSTPTPDLSNVVFLDDYRVVKLGSFRPEYNQPGRVRPLVVARPPGSTAH